jgi:hypothetical protein
VLAQVYNKIKTAGEKTVRRAAIALLVSLLGIVTACGKSDNSPTTGSVLNGNWEITLNSHASTDPQTFSGFLLQSGNTISGSLILGAGCNGVGPVTGTLDNQNLSMSINEFGQAVSLVGIAPTGASGAMSGEFSTLAGGCTPLADTGTWSGRMIPPISGNFHGSFQSPSNGTVNVTGMLQQGSNTGASNASVTGTLDALPPQQFCAYVTSATISGTISGTNVTLKLFGPDGVQFTQLDASVTPDGTSLTAPSYVFPTISSNCNGDQGTFQITFP